jgi:hypothetical protein
MTQLVFCIVAKYVEYPHIVQEVEETTVQKHEAEKGENCWPESK